MTLELAKALVDASEGCLELHEDYSGRGMMGATTTGVVGSLGTLLAVLAIVAQEDDAGVVRLADLERVRSDGLGRDTIYY